MVITQNGHAKAVLQDAHSHAQTQETLALLKILALGQKKVADGKVMSLEEAFARARG
jgi:PHD/YefM family antitoxin component YafN of YafNO toxin-antitoxin module